MTEGCDFASTTACRNGLPKTPSFSSLLHSHFRSFHATLHGAEAPLSLICACPAVVVTRRLCCCPLCRECCVILSHMRPPAQLPRMAVLLLTSTRFPSASYSRCRPAASATDIFPGITSCISCMYARSHQSVSETLLLLAEESSSARSLCILSSLEAGKQSATVAGERPTYERLIIDKPRKGYAHAPALPLKLHPLLQTQHCASAACKHHECACA